MLPDSWREHDALECAIKTAPSNAEESPRRQHCKIIPKNLYRYRFAGTSKLALCTFNQVTLLDRKFYALYFKRNQFTEGLAEI